MRPIIKGLNVLIAVLASCILGLTLYGVLRQSVELPDRIVAHAETQPQATSSESTDYGDPWGEGTRLAERGLWEQATDHLECALEQKPEEPERYLLLAQAYRETGRDTDAAEVLRSGVAVTGAEELELSLKAIESSLEIPEDQRVFLEALYTAFSAEEEALISGALQNWESGQRVQDDAGNYIQNPLWVKTGNLTWDGERFWGDYTGTGLLLYGESIYYGTISQGVPNGDGICVTVHTWFPDGAVSYLRLDGQWENGVALGEVEFYERCTDAAEHVTEYDMTATLDGTTAEVITHGEVTVRFSVNGTVHTFLIAIQNGTLSQAEFSNSVTHCSAHSDCRATLSVRNDSFSKTYQNPYPWAKESPYEDPWDFLNFSYGY